MQTQVFRIRSRRMLVLLRPFVQRLYGLPNVNASFQNVVEGRGERPRVDDGGYTRCRWWWQHVDSYTDDNKLVYGNKDARSPSEYGLKSCQENCVGVVIA